MPHDRGRAGALLSIGLALLVGCGEGASSQLEPSAPLDTLSDGAAAQLCRFTVDVLADADWACTGEEAPTAQVDFEACRASPPWGAFADVGAWEDCVNARDVDPCATDPVCAP